MNRLTLMTYNTPVKDYNAGILTGASDSALFLHLPVPCWIYDRASLRFTAVNIAAIVAYGYSREEFLTMTIKDIRPAEDIERVVQAVQERILLTGPQRSIWKHKRKNGDVFDVHISSVCITDHQIAVVANDITETTFVQHHRDRLMHLLRRRKEDLDLTLSEINEVAWAIRTDTFQLLYSNEATQNVYGYSPEEMMADSDIFFNSIHEDDRGVFDLALQQALTNGRSTASFRVYHRDGTVRHLVGSAFLRKSANLPYDILRGFTSDVTSQQRLQDQLAYEERKLKSMINNTNDLIWSMDCSLRINGYNEAFRRRLATMTGKHLEDIRDTDFELDAFAHWKDLFHRALAGETVRTIYESEVGGVPRFEETILNPILDDAGQIVGISCFSRDVTERKKYIREIEAQNKRLQDIAWIQSHKVRSHVATLLGLQPLLDCEHPENPDNKLIMDGMNNELAALDNIIKEINALSFGLQEPR